MSSGASATHTLPLKPPKTNRMLTPYLSRAAELLTYDSAAPMLFNSGLFLVLFLLFLPLYYLLRRLTLARIIYVVCFSLFFYYKSSGYYALILIMTATVDFIIGHLIAGTPERKVKRRWLILSLCFNLGMLGYFKYTNFLLELFTPLVQWIGGLVGVSEMTATQLGPLDIFLPVGISFFTFQSLSYVIDIYRGEIRPLRRWVDYLFYVSFFPQLVAGPIVRAKDFIPQIYRPIRVTQQEFGEGLFLILSGLIKKAIISDYISLNFVDRVFDAPTLYSGFENLMAIYGYALQIYCDFSGYSDMAIGIALWLGFRFNINFDSPYRSATITEFWRRWHISLSSWLRDYLYIPLGGSRRGRLRTYLNLLVTMLLGGLWHGASLRFILWGGMHGVALALHKLYMQICPWARLDGASMGRFRRYLGMILTFHFVCFAWIFFRMPTMEGIGQMFEMIRYEFHPEIIPQFIEGYWLVVTLIVLGFVAHFIPQRAFRPLERSISRMPLIGQALLFALVVLLVVQFQSSGVQPFIYFQF